MTDDRGIDEILGIVRCERCGHRLNGEIECPFCSLFPDPHRKGSRKWVFITACFLTSPLSIWFVVTSKRLNRVEKIFTLCGCLVWLGLYFLWM